MKLFVAGSGSKGNCTVVASGQTTILVDVGIPYRDVCVSMKRAGISPDSISAILMTHAHTDHFRCIAPFAKKASFTFFATEETASSIEFFLENGTAQPSIQIDWAYIMPNHAFEIGGLSITSFEVSHDANGAVGYTITDGTSKIGIATDLGYISRPVASNLSDCDAIVLEMNHDERMLMESNRHDYLKKRISSDFGHLSNSQAADFVESLASKKLRYLLPAHISRECNEKSIIDATLNSLKNRRSFQVVETHQNQASDLVFL